MGKLAPSTETNLAPTGIDTLYSNVSVESKSTAEVLIKFCSSKPEESSFTVVLAIGDNTKSFAKPLALGRSVKVVETTALSAVLRTLPIAQFSVACN